MRTAGAAVLMILAALLAGVAVSGSFVDRLAHTAEPARQIAGDLPRDEAVRAALPAVLVDAVRSGIPDGIVVPDALEGPLERASSRAVSAVLDSPGFHDAWLESIDASRQAYVDRLAEVRAGTSQSASATLELGPLATRGAEGLKQAAGGLGLGFLLESWQTDVTATVPLGLPGADAGGSSRIATILWLSGSWAWAALGAVVLAVAGLLLARRRARGGMLVLGGVVVCLWAAGLLVLAVGMVPEGPRIPESATSIGAIVKARVLEGLSKQVHGTALWSLLGGGVVVAAGSVTGLLVGRRRNR